MNLKIIKNWLKPLALQKANVPGMSRRAMVEIRQDILKKLLIRIKKLPSWEKPISVPPKDFSATDVAEIFET
jgi:hypothetical protein